MKQRPKLLSRIAALVGLTAAVAPLPDIGSLVHMPRMQHQGALPQSRRGHSGVPRARRAAAKISNQLRGGRR